VRACVCVCVSVRAPASVCVCARVVCARAQAAALLRETEWARKSERLTTELATVERLGSMLASLSSTLKQLDPSVWQSVQAGSRQARARPPYCRLLSTKARVAGEAQPYRVLMHRPAAARPTSRRLLWGSRRCGR
jgi:hypothetical protein